MLKIATIVVTYNRKEKLIRCLQHIQDQNLSTDIIVIDNMSTDGTQEVLKSLIQNHKIIYKRLEKNIGGAGGFSEGIKYAYNLGYEYFWVMDDDCMPKQDALSN